MSRVILELSVSLDGYAAGSNVSPENPMGDNGERLHDWMFVDATETGRLFDPQRGRFQRLEATRTVDDAGVTHLSLTPSHDTSH